MTELPDDPILYISGGDPGRILLTMWVTDGQTVIRYHPEDLDEATQEFLAELKKTSEQAFKVLIDRNKKAIEEEMDKKIRRTNGV